MSDDKIMSEGYQKRVDFGPADATKSAFGPVGLIGAALNPYAAIGKIASPISFADELRNRLGKTNEKIVENAAEAKRLLQLRSELEASLTAISALTPPLQHKGGETEADAAAEEVFETGCIRDFIELGKWTRAKDFVFPEASDNPPVIEYLVASPSCYNSDDYVIGEARFEAGSYWFGNRQPYAYRVVPKDNVSTAIEIPDGFTVWEGGACPFPLGATLEVLTRRCGVWPIDVKNETPLLWVHEGHDLDIIAYRIIEATADQVRTTDSDASSGDERIEQTISTLQASSGEGEKTSICADTQNDGAGGASQPLTSDGRVGQCDVTHSAPEAPDGFTAWDATSNCRFVGDTIVKCWMGGDDYMGPLRAGDVDWDHKSDPVLAVKVIRYADGSEPTDTPTEPAAYSPVNNADEPVTKPEADFFAQAILPVQSGIEFSVDGGPKQATGAAKLFGGLGIFGKPKALVGEGA